MHTNNYSARFSSNDTFIIVLLLITSLSFLVWACVDHPAWGTTAISIFAFLAMWFGAVMTKKQEDIFVRYSGWAIIWINVFNIIILISQINSPMPGM